MLRLFLVGAVLILLSIVYVLRFDHFVRSLSGYRTANKDGYAGQVFPLLNTAQIVQLGMAHRSGMRPTSSYTLIGQSKPPGTTRVGVFGCSFVQGSEAMPGRDFPSQLQQLFFDAGEEPVQIVNFGVGAYGMQQSFLMWEYLGTQFDLDYTIFNLYGFHQQRDDTFVMTNTTYAPVHGRYVLEEDAFRFVEVRGADRREASRRYFQLIPAWRYLRYDAKTPPQLRALLPWDHELPSNPFYYRSDRSQEVAELYNRFFSEVHSRSDNFVVLLNDQRSVRAAGNPKPKLEYPSAQAKSEKYTWERRGLFRALKNHPSALGYSVMAKEVMAILTGCPDTKFPDLRILGASVDDSDSLDSSFAAFDEVVLSFDGAPVGVLVEPIDGRLVRPFLLRSSDSIIDLSGGREPSFVALGSKLSRGRLRVVFRVDGVRAEADIGDVSRVGGDRVGVVDRTWSSLDGGGWRLVGDPEGGAISISMETDRSVSEIELQYADMTLLRGELQPTKRQHWFRLVWSSAGGTLLTTRGHPEQDPRVIADAGAGRYCLTAETKNQPSRTVCTRTWTLSSHHQSVDLAEITPIGSSR